MDSVEMAETMASTVPSDFSCPHEVKAVAARRRRTEIRRFKLIAGCGEFLESANKRLKSNVGAPVKMASVEVRSSVESAKPACCSCLTEQPSITCEACQQRGDSIIVVSDAVPSKSERVISVPELLRSGGGASGNALPDRHDGGILKESRENLSRACNSAGASGLLSHATSGSEGRMQGASPEQASRTDIDRRERNEDSDVFPQSRNLVTTCKQDRKVWRKLCAELKCPPHGVVSVIGRRREMEDAAVAVPAFLSLSETVVNGCSGSGMMSSGTLMPLHFFGVYDGHGGSQAALLCKDRLHQALAEEMKALYSAQTSQLGNSVGWRSMWEKAMAASFLRMDREVGGACPRGTQCRKEEGSDYSCCAEAVVPETVGSTAVAAVVGAGQIVVANCGDSRAVLSRGGRALPLSQDHKPEREDEMSRIEAAGGRVIRWNGFRVLGVLAMSRAIGDRFLKPYIIAEPDVTLVERSEEDECLILASDGLWDVLSNEVVCEVTRRFLAARKRGKRGTGAAAASSEVEEEDEEEDSPAEAAAALLTKLALARGSRDNISVVVVDLQKQPSQKPPSTPILT